MEDSVNAGARPATPTPEGLGQLLERSSAARRRLLTATPEFGGDDGAEDPYQDPSLRLVLPVGHFAGPMFTNGRATAPESFEVRFLDGVFSLSAAEYAVWAVAHGDPQRVGRHPVTREFVTGAARSAGVEDPEPLLDSLLADRLLTITGVRGDDARSFAERHQVRPLALGLGNSADKPAEFQIGLPSAPRVSVGYDVYHMWLFAHRMNTLWESLTTIAAEAEESNAEERDGSTGVRLVDDPNVLLAAIMGALPILLSTSCVYLDRAAS